MIQTLAFKNLVTHGDLLLAWTSRIIRARYQQSILGGLWAIIQPLAVAAIFTVIFTLFIPVDTGPIPYVVFAYAAMVPWVLFSGSLTEMTDSLVTNMNLVSKIYFPREIFPIAALLARLVDFAIAWVLIFALIVYYQLPFLTTTWLALPVVLAIQVALCLGLGLIGAALNVFYRDIKHLIALGLQVWLYATPIIYPVTAVPEKYRSFYFINPMAGIIEAYRAIILRNELPDDYLLISALIAIVILVAGYWFFKKVEFQFADII